MSGSLAAIARAGLQAPDVRTRCAPGAQRSHSFQPPRAAAMADAEAAERHQRDHEEAEGTLPEPKRLDEETWARTRSGSAACYCAEASTPCSSGADAAET